MGLEWERRATATARAAATTVPIPHRHGLRGLADRTEILGGSLDVASPRGAGTHIRAQISLDAH